MYLYIAGTTIILHCLVNWTAQMMNKLKFVASLTVTASQYECKLFLLWDLKQRIALKLINLL